MTSEEAFREVFKDYILDGKINQVEIQIKGIAKKLGIERFNKRPDQERMAEFLLWWFYSEGGILNGRESTWLFNEMKEYINRFLDFDLVGVWTKKDSIEARCASTSER